MAASCIPVLASPGFGVPGCALAFPCAGGFAGEMTEQTPTSAARPSDDDAELLARIAGGEAEAFAAFYDRHSALLFGMACRMLGDVHEAEDVLQDAAVLLWERAPLYNPMYGKPLSWAVTLLRNKAVDRIRAAKRKSSLHEAAAAEPDPAAADPAPGLPSETASTLRKALAELPDQQRQAINLAFFDGLTQQEIADRIGAPLGTVKARIRRGMLTLRDVLGDNL